MKKLLLLITLTSVFALGACKKEVNEAEDQKVNEMLKTDKQRSDSAKRALGIE